MITPTWATTFWLGSLLFVLGVIGYLVWRNQEQRAEIDSLNDRIERAGLNKHVCRPPAWASRGPNGWIRPEVLSHWVCVCGTRYVLVRTFQPRPDGPFRLGWITESEHATGRAPSGVQQEPESRLDGLPGGHRRQGAL
jgi:hypothetical protein